MIFSQTYFKISDNSGARLVKCLKVYNRSIRQGAYGGDIVLVSVKTYIVKDKLEIRSGDKLRVAIIRTKRPLYRVEGVFINFDVNSGVVLLNDQKIPKGTRVFGPIYFELRRLRFFKIVSLSARLF